MVGVEAKLGLTPFDGPVSGVGVLSSAAKGVTDAVGLAAGATVSWGVGLEPDRLANRSDVAGGDVTDWKVC